MVGCIVHFDAAGLPGPRLSGGRHGERQHKEGGGARREAAELCTSAALLVSRLQQAGVPPVLLLQCSASADAAACVAAAQAAADAADAPLVVAQPGQFPMSLRLALDHLSPAAPANTVFVSVSDTLGYASQAAELGCATEHMSARTASPAQLQAWGLQAVACLAAASAQLPPLMVGYVMKESRQLALSAQGMLPLLPPGDAAAGRTADSGGGMCFMPLDLGSSLAHQLRRCQVVLQKLTDCLQPGRGSGAVAAFNREASALLAFLEQQAQQGTAPRQQPDFLAGGGSAAAEGEAGAAQPVCMVDSVAALRTVMDRAKLVPHMEAAALAVRQLGIPMRAPASLLLHTADATATPRALAAAGVQLPCIVKPQAACGVAEAHQMAFVLHGSGFADLDVPLPAVAQEYVDHGGVVCKVYVAGQQVFWTQRPSTPDLGPLAEQLASNPDADIPANIGFDSLKSLPTTLPWLRRSGGQAAEAQQAGAGSGGGGGSEQPPPAAVPGQELMRRQTFEAVAAALRQRLGLTLFGFDLVFDAAAGELVMIDLNYFPSFKGVAEAPEALQLALRERYAAHCRALEQQRQQAAPAAAPGGP